MPFRLFVFLATVSLGALLGCGPSPQPQERGPNIVMIVVDTLRADRLGLYGYQRPTTPNVDRWFGESMIFDHAYAPISFTPPSVISMLSGVYPMKHRVRMVFQKIPDRVAIIPDYLKPLGYHTAAVVSNMVLTTEATHLGPRFDYFDDYVDEFVPIRKGFERNAQRTTDAAVEWLEKARFLKQPHFLWLHYMDPHGPYLPPPEKPVAFSHETPAEIDINRIPTYNRLDGNTDGLYYVDRYDEEVAFTDAQIGRFLEIYKNAGFLDDAIVIFVSDHGETHMEHEQWFTHGYHVYEESTRVPLMIRGPALTAQRISTPVSLVDLAPTILQFAGGKNASVFDGGSLLDPKPRDIFLEGLGGARKEGVGRQYRGLVRDRHKWVIYSEAGVEDPEYRRFFDLAGDPLELAPKPWSESPGFPKRLVNMLKDDPDPSGLPIGVSAGARLNQAKAKPKGGLHLVVDGLDEETLERLRSLGYIE